MRETKIEQRKITPSRGYVVYDPERGGDGSEFALMSRPLRL